MCSGCCLSLLCLDASFEAMSYFADGDLPQLPQAVQDRLRHESSVLRDIPQRERTSDRISPSE